MTLRAQFRDLFQESQRHFGDSLHEHASSYHKSRCIAFKKSIRSTTTAGKFRTPITNSANIFLKNIPQIKFSLHPTRSPPYTPQASKAKLKNLPMDPLCAFIIHVLFTFHHLFSQPAFVPFEIPSARTKAFSELSHFCITVLLEDLRGIGILLRDGWRVFQTLVVVSETPPQKTSKAKKKGKQEEEKATTWELISISNPYR